MGQVWLVRHGQASFGAADYDRLSTLGQQQARWLGEFFAARSCTFDAVLLGTMRRHEETAQAIVAGLGTELPCFSDASLNEYDFLALLQAFQRMMDLPPMSSWERSSFYPRLKQALQLWVQGELSEAIPETWQAFQARVEAARHWVATHGAQRVLVVSSGGVIGTWVQQVLSAPALTAIELNLQVRNASVSEFFFREQRWRLSAFNQIAHLDQPQRQHAITYS